MTPDHVFQRVCCIVEELETMAPAVPESPHQLLLAGAVAVLTALCHMMAQGLSVKDAA